jgi:hypothetical protein
MFRHLDVITRYLTRSGALDVLSQGWVVCVPLIRIEHDPNISSVGGCLGEVSSELVTHYNTDGYEAGGVGGRASRREAPASPAGAGLLCLYTRTVVEDPLKSVPMLWVSVFLPFLPSRRPFLLDRSKVSRFLRLRG